MFTCYLLFHYIFTSFDAFSLLPDKDNADIK